MRIEEIQTKTKKWLENTNVKNELTIILNNEIAENTIKTYKIFEKLMKSKLFYQKDIIELGKALHKLLICFEKYDNPYSSKINKIFEYIKLEYCKNKQFYNPSDLAWYYNEFKKFIEDFKTKLSELKKSN